VACLGPSLVFSPRLALCQAGNASSRPLGDSIGTLNRNRRYLRGLALPFFTSSPSTSPFLRAQTERAATPSITQERATPRNDTATWGGAKPATIDLGIGGGEVTQAVTKPMSEIKDVEGTVLVAGGFRYIIADKASSPASGARYRDHAALTFLSPLPLRQKLG
jgi:hypothetical protein